MYSDSSDERGMLCKIDLDSFIVWLLTQLDTDSGDAEREARIYERVFSKNDETQNDEQK